MDHHGRLILLHDQQQSSLSTQELKEELELELPLNFIQHLSSDDSDNMQALCRICLSISNSELFPLHCKNEDMQLPNMFRFFTSISIDPNDGLPSSVCEACKSQIVNCYEFKMKCIKSDSTLRTLIKGEMDGKPVTLHVNGLTTKENEEEYKYESRTEVKPDEIDKEITDIQYLEDFGDCDSENETLCIVQKICTRKKSGRKNLKGKKKKKLNDTKQIKIEEVAETKDNILNADIPETNNKSLSTFDCHLCSKQFKSRKSLGSHLSLGPCTGGVSCNVCGRAFISAHDLRLHSALHRAGPLWTCDICQKQFTRLSQFRRHVQRHMEWKRHSCVTCGKRFAELYALRRHQRVHTGECQLKRYQCHLCDKRYSSAHVLSLHVSRHSGARPCVCACGRAFPTPRLLRSHARVHDDHKPYKCGYCEKRFRHESTRNTHHRTHTGEKPYVCSVCGKTFIQNSNLTLHMRTHTGEKPYKCEECGRQFSSGSSLKNHVRSHTGEKPYSCPTCGKKFARMDLRAHMSVHTGARAHRCALCTRTFARAARLRDHTRTHTGEKPFECDVCPQKYATKAHLVKHTKTHVKKKKPQKSYISNPKDAYISPDKYIITRESDSINDCISENPSINLHIDTDTEMPPEVSNELIVHDDCDAKSELVVVEDQNTEYHNETLCCTNGVYENSEVNYGSNVNLVTVNEEGLSISASSAMLEGTTVKLYQLDQSQSLVQIHSMAGQVTISKITSKMTTNF